jgi:hypothetical protein
MVAFRIWPGSWSVAIGGNQSRQFRSFMTRACSGMRLGALERAAGWAMPGLNNLARLAFYRAVLR